MDLFLILLYLHVLGAIIAFGPGFISMVVGPMVAKEPQHANFYARTQVAAGKKVITPVALSMAVTGIAMILYRGPEMFFGERHWLEAGILLYVVAVVVAMAVQAPAGRKLVELTAQPPAPGTPPNPAIPAAAKRLRLGGAALVVLTIVIAFLMVTKPF